MIPDQEKQALKERLERERVELTAELGRLQNLIVQEGQYSETERGGVGNHLADDASDTFEQEKYVALRRNAERILDQVNHALRSMETGEYGKCENCKQDIPLERLQALPYAQSCITCQAQGEKRH